MVITYEGVLVDQLTRDYIQQSVRRPRAGRPRSSLGNQPERLDSRKHFLAKRTVKEQCECILCSKSTKRKRIVYHCKTWQDHPPLCPIPCFEKYHTK